MKDCIFCKIIKGEKTLANTPVIIISGEKIDDEDLKDTEKSEIYELISEIDIQELLIKGIGNSLI